MCAARTYSADPRIQTADTACTTARTGWFVLNSDVTTSLCYCTKSVRLLCECSKYLGSSRSRGKF